MSVTRTSLPFLFEENQGQAPEPVRFLAHRGPLTMLALPTGVDFLLAVAAPPARTPPAPAVLVSPEVPLRGPHASPDPRTPQPTGRAVFRMRLVGVGAGTAVTGLDPQIGKVNYFLGNDPRQWRTGIATFGRVAWEEPWPGIRLVFYTNKGALEHDFVVAPGADPRRIRMKFEGGQAPRIGPGGELILGAELGELRFGRPSAYQDSPCGRAVVPCRWVLRGRRVAGFEVDPYDSTRPLIIDPVVACRACR
jgi:hypothetical protein